MSDDIKLFLNINYIEDSLTFPKDYPSTCPNAPPGFLEFPLKVLR